MNIVWCIGNQIMLIHVVICYNADLNKFFFIKKGARKIKNSILKKKLFDIVFYYYKEHERFSRAENNKIV